MSSLYMTIKLTIFSLIIQLFNAIFENYKFYKTEDDSEIIRINTYGKMVVFLTKHNIYTQNPENLYELIATPILLKNDDTFEPLPCTVGVLFNSQMISIGCLNNTLLGIIDITSGECNKVAGFSELVDTILWKYVDYYTDINYLPKAPVSIISFDEMIILANLNSRDYPNDYPVLFFMFMI